MGRPVVSVASGGMAVVETPFGTPVTEAANGFGMPVTKVVGRPGMPVVYETIGVAPAVVYATFDPAAATGVTLSNGNLTVTHTALSPGGSVTTLLAYTGKKYYFEVRTGSSSFQTVDVVGVFKTGTSMGVQPTGGVIVINVAPQGASLGAFVANDVAGFAFDLTGNLMWIRKNAGNWNASGTASPATGVGGITIPAGSYFGYISFANFNPAGTNWTANFGATSYAQTPPAGFVNLGA